MSALLAVLAPVAALAADVEAPKTWRDIVTDADRERLRGWRDAWQHALGRTVPGDPLLDPDRVLAGSVPPPGPYRCRLLRLRDPEGFGGSTASDWGGCRIAAQGGTLAFERLGGIQRQIGTIYPDTPTRSILLGTLVIGDERRPIPYGRDTRRDVIGAVERVGPARWRLVMPFPRFGATLDLLELVPAPQ